MRARARGGCLFWLCIRVSSCVERASRVRAPWLAGSDEGVDVGRACLVACGFLLGQAGDSQPASQQAAAEGREDVGRRDCDD